MRGIGEERQDRRKNDGTQRDLHGSPCRAVRCLFEILYSPYRSSCFNLLLPAFVLYIDLY